MNEDEFALICSLKEYPSSLLQQQSTTSASAVTDGGDVVAAADGASSSSVSSPPLTVSEETFAVIKRQIEHRRFRTALRIHRQEKALKKYIARHGKLDAVNAAHTTTTTAVMDAKKKPRETIYEIATSVDFSPCMMARVLLEAKYGWSKTTISNFFKEAFSEAYDDAGTGTRGSRKEPNWRGLSEREYTQLLHEVGAAYVCGFDSVEHPLG